MFLPLLAACFQPVFAQDAPAAQTILRGKITDKKDKSPIAHVSVAEVDKDGRIVRGVTTDIDGNYALKISNPNHKVSISYIGYKTEELDLKGRTTLNMAIEANTANSLNDVVVVGGRRTDNGNLSISDKNLTIATVKIQAKDLEELGAAGTTASQKIDSVGGNSEKLVPLRTQIKNLKLEMQALEDAGEDGSKRFQDLEIQAARLTDRMGDQQARIRILSSDTLKFDFGLSAMNLATNGYQAITAAMQLFGTENEDVIKAMQKFTATYHLL